MRNTFWDSIYCAFISENESQDFVPGASSGGECMCKTGYTGQNCENEYIPCDPSPCMNGGSCRQLDQLEYECHCPQGTTQQGRSSISLHAQRGGWLIRSLGSA
ncbi:hypothetical protein PV326_000317 [Microctonus aethiopoides]|nr:hypothetical protein PV326_000317 [Microctonus aethiopoides]